MSRWKTCGRLKNIGLAGNLTMLHLLANLYCTWSLILGSRKLIRMYNSDTHIKKIKITSLYIHFLFLSSINLSILYSKHLWGNLDLKYNNFFFCDRLLSIVTVCRLNLYKIVLDQFIPYANIFFYRLINQPINFIN